MNQIASRVNEAVAVSQTRRLSEVFAVLAGAFGESLGATSGGTTPQLSATWASVDADPEDAMRQIGATIDWSTKSMRQRNAPADCAFLTGSVGSDVLVYAKFFPLQGSQPPYRMEVLLLPNADPSTPGANLTHAFRIVDEVLGNDDVARILGAYVDHCLGRANRKDQDLIIADIVTALSEVLRDRVS